MQKITYGFYTSSFGKMVLGQTERGLCWLGFMVSRQNGAYKGDGLERMKEHFPKTVFIHDDSKIIPTAKNVLKAWQEDHLDQVSLDMKGTNFQLDVWRALLKIPKGQTVSYGQIANDIGRPKSQRAVGTAVGSNPVSLVVPCHRVVQSSGRLGNYGWGVELKEKILQLET